jgi:hypothetical protein
MTMIIMFTIIVKLSEILILNEKKFIIFPIVKAINKQKSPFLNEKNGFVLKSKL